MIGKANRRWALLLAGVYALVGAAWIFFSDRFFATVAADAAQLTTYQTYKGWGFVVVTTLLVYSLLRLAQRRDARRVEEAEQRWRAEQALRASEAKFRRLVEGLNADYVFYQHDAAGVVTYLSPSVENVLGYTPAELSTDYARIFTDSPLNDEVRTRTALTLSGQAQPGYEVEVYHKNGSRRRMEVLEFPVFGPDGQVTLVEGIGHDVSARLEVERALRERLALQDQLEKISATVPGMIGTFRRRADGVLSVPYASAALRELFGLEPAQVRDDAEPMLALIHPADIGRVLEGFERSGADLLPFHQEFRVRHPRKGEIWVEIRSVPARDADGAVQWHGFGHDTTERKCYEDKLAAGAERLRLTLEAARVVTWDLDISRGTVHNEGPIAEMYGKPHGYTHHSLDDFIESLHPDDRARLRQEVGAAVRGEAPFSSEFRILRSDGLTCWIMSTGSLRRDARGRPARLLGIAREITNQKNAEAQLRLAARVFDRAAEGVVVTDSQQQILTVNNAFTAVTGYRIEEVIGKTPALLHSGRHEAEFYRAMWRSLGEKGWWQGEIWNRRKNGEIYAEWLSISAVRDRDGQVVNYVGMFSDITALKESERRMEYLATHDELTGLPNRAVFADRLRLALARAERAAAKIALLFVDLDNFKIINDTLGHQVGDALLQEAARRLTGCVREEDSVARLGGDEFVILLEGEGRDDAAISAERILQTLGADYAVADRECFLTASIGISLFPEDAGDADTLMRNADTAMYRAKEHGKNGFEFFTGEMAEQANLRLSIESGLRRDLQRGGVFVEYQPQIELASGRLSGVEALVRWRANGTVQAPAHFIRVAEETGLIVDLDEWVLRDACRQLRAWEAAGLARIPVSVNVSPRHFRQADIVTRIDRIVREAGVAPQHLCLEITESALLDVERAQRMLHELEALGFRLSIDDFGTGFSSLSYLKRFPIHELKIDRSFIDGVAGDPEDRAITSAIIAMAGSLGLEVVAEGIETPAQQAELLALGCRFGQGYLYARPLDVEKLADWIADRRGG